MILGNLFGEVPESRLDVAQNALFKMRLGPGLLALVTRLVQQSGWPDSDGPADSVRVHRWMVVNALVVVDGG